MWFNKKHNILPNSVKKSAFFWEKQSKSAPEVADFYILYIPPPNHNILRKNKVNLARGQADSKKPCASTEKPLENKANLTRRRAGSQVSCFQTKTKNRNQSAPDSPLARKFRIAIEISSENKGNLAIRPAGSKIIVWQ